MSKFKLDYQKGIIFCRAKIINKSESVILKLALDTGATHTMISPESAFGIGLNPFASKRKIEITTGGGIILAPIITIPRFCAFGYELKNLEIICHSLPSESTIEGLLGLNFLKSFKVTLNFPKNIIEIIK